MTQTNGLVMGYFDGNTVTGMWNYAQNFALNDNSFGSDFGPSTVGVINLVSGQTNGAIATLNGTGDEVSGGSDGSLTVIGDPDPHRRRLLQPHSQPGHHGRQDHRRSPHRGRRDLGRIHGRLQPVDRESNGTTGCARSTTSAVTGVTESDYIPHHSLFAYWPSVANPTHTRPASVAEIGNPGPANHQYDIEDFYAAVAAGNLPAVSFLKAPGLSGRTRRLLRSAG